MGVFLEYHYGFFSSTKMSHYGIIYVTMAHLAVITNDNHGVHSHSLSSTRITITNTDFYFRYLYWRVESDLVVFFAKPLILYANNQNKNSEINASALLAE